MNVSNDAQDRLKRYVLAFALAVIALLLRISLPVAEGIVEAHGGQLSVGRNEPHGAVFRLSLTAGKGRP